MSYSDRDLVEAFDCAEERAEGVGDMRALVTLHLRGQCGCDRNRCPHCKCRPRNKMPRHKDGCPRGFKRI